MQINCLHTSSYEDSMIRIFKKTFSSWLLLPRTISISRKSQKLSSLRKLATDPGSFSTMRIWDFINSANTKSRNGTIKQTPEFLTKSAHIVEKSVTDTVLLQRSEKLSALLSESNVQIASSTIITHRCVKRRLEKLMHWNPGIDPRKQAP